MQHLFRQVIRSASMLVVLMAAVLCSTYTQADEQQRLNKIKAAFALNISRFTRWPEEISGNNDALTMCFYRRDFLQGSAATINNKMVNNKKLYIAVIDSLAEAASCQVLLIANAEEAVFVVEAQKHTLVGVLTIIDRINAIEVDIADSPIMISLVRKGKTVGFDINTAKLNEAGLSVSSQLLNLARKTD